MKHNNLVEELIKTKNRMELSNISVEEENKYMEKYKLNYKEYSEQRCFASEIYDEILFNLPAMKRARIQAAIDTNEFIEKFDKTVSEGGVN